MKIQSSMDSCSTSKVKKTTAENSEKQPREKKNQWRGLL
jgi:hypothetical protein